MKSSRRRLLTLLAALPALLVTIAFTYMQVMAAFEGEPRNFLDAVEWASETITTTGYGRDAEWDHPVTIAFVILMQFLGVFLVYMLVPLFLLPMLEERFEARLPRQAPNDLDDHVVIFRWGPAVETLLDELVAADVPLLVADLDEAACRSVADRTERLDKVHVLLESSIARALGAARLEQARALVTNGSDEQDTVVVLIARELGFQGPVLALAEEPFHGRALASAGASEVVTPRHELGAALAARASPRVQPRVGGIEPLRPMLRVAEIRVDPGSALAGQTLAASDLGSRTGAQIIGQWVRGHLDARPGPDTIIEAGGILLAIGRSDSLDRLVGSAAGSLRSVRADGPFLIVGYGEVGRKIADLLRAAGEGVIVVDKEASIDDVDVVGDISDPGTLERLGLERARALLLALDNDSATLFATLILKDEAPDLPIFARVNAAENLDRLYRAGADFAVSIAEISASILGRRLLDRPSRALDTELQIVSVEATDLAHRHLASLDVRHRFGCSVVAVERGGELLTELDSDFHFQPKDRVHLCGHRDDTDRFLRELVS